MANKVTVDTRELDQWGALLALAGADALVEGNGIVAKGALSVKNDARRLAPVTPHAPYYAASINYDLSTGPDFVEAEVGPVEGRRQRGLGNLLEYGGHGTAPHPHHEPAADAEEPRFYTQSEELVARLVLRHG